MKSAHNLLIFPTFVSEQKVAKRGMEMMVLLLPAQRALGTCLERPNLSAAIKNGILVWDKTFFSSGDYQDLENIT